VIFTIIDGKLKILLIERSDNGKLALPGGFVEIGESLEHAAERELEEESGVKNVYLEQLFTFGNPDRDPRERIITVAYYALVAPNKAIQAGSDAKNVGWYDVGIKPDVLAFDHHKILAKALERIRGKLEYTTIGFELLPKNFTLTDLQKVYEAILDTKLDTRNFRKKILQQKGIKELPKKQEGEPHRPATLYAKKG
jgi:8-oxo-dGTP diphosphatase